VTSIFARVDCPKKGKCCTIKPNLNRQQIDHARKLIDNGQLREDVAALFNVNRTTLYLAFAV